MPIYFTSNVVNPPVTLFMGFDKVENEELIRWGWPEDVWFHVDKLSSAHVYLRLKQGQTVDDMTPELIEDCSQLVKANSIMGNKQNDVGIVYTMWDNLKKTGDMAVGQVGFHSDKQVKKCMVEKRKNEIVNRLNKTRVERTDVDFRAEREERDRLERNEQKKLVKEFKKKEDEERMQREEEKRIKSYDGMFTAEKMQSNRGIIDDDDDFM